MKLLQITLTVLISILSVSNGNAKADYSIIKGKAIDWPTDTVYLQTMPFYSPYSIELDFRILDEDHTFRFELENKKIPWVVQLFPNKRNADLNREQLLFLNYTDDYYYGHCKKFYTYSASTFLLEPGNILDIELKSNRTLEKLSSEMAAKYREAGAVITENNTIELEKETTIRFLEENSFQYEYFQNTFDLEDQVDKRLELYRGKPIEKAEESYAKIRKKLLDNLESVKGNLSPTFYEYIKAEIEFGARVEFLKYLMFSDKEETEPLDSFFSKEISQEIIDIVEFNKNEVSPVVMASEAYNKYLELYLNFKLNVQNKKFSPFNELSKIKCKTAIRELPKESAYYYIAGQLLHYFRTEDFAEDLLIATIKEFPEGELNDKLMEKYDL